MGNKVTIKKASETIGVSPDTIRRWGKRGLVKSSRSKQNYRIFDLDEIKSLNNNYLHNNKHTGKYKILKNGKPTKYTSIELFAGAGGTALGFENAGINHTLLVELDKHAVGTLRRNRPDWRVVGEDIRNVSFIEEKADIVQGGFPCQAFSYAGQKKGFGDTRGTLFFEFARAVKEIKPKIAIGENVRGLLRHDNGRTLNTMIKTLQALEYSVGYKLLRSQYLDVPQKRERLIIVAVRKDLNLPILVPKEKNYIIPIKEVLRNVPESAGIEYNEKKKFYLDLVPQGGCWRHLPIELQKTYMGKSFFSGGGKTGMARRLSWDEPSLTLTCHPAQKQTERCHPSETRPLNVREYARIQTFPDDWTFEGSITSQYKQIGNAVPVNLGFHIAQCAIAILRKKPNPMTMEELTPVRNLDQTDEITLFPDVSS
ncbi:DNA (cytosine-5-)-methyltransferase [Patescibacteria group bacterium]|nr:DNA (cytosine-5-)-methyltransferase [Patescibacteria group bacterium]MBU1256093.1 DNA (cytosine-5-)-methyltransferase [Patescibacteria group bacterium]MBU1457755.1 DNA (cytosine-5-)-methyltransferase [Patescibacteria group bacterium]